MSSSTAAKQFRQRDADEEGSGGGLKGLHSVWVTDPVVTTILDCAVLVLSLTVEEEVSV